MATQDMDCPPLNEKSWLCLSGLMGELAKLMPKDEAIRSRVAGAVVDGAIVIAESKDYGNVDPIDEETMQSISEASSLRAQTKGNPGLVYL